MLKILDLRTGKEKTTGETRAEGIESPKEVYQKSEQMGHGNLLLRGSASRMTNLWTHTGPFTQKGLLIILLICSHHLEILSIF